MAKEQRFIGTSPRLGLHASRRGLLQAGLAIGTLALGQRAALGQGGGANSVWRTCRLRRRWISR